METEAPKNLDVALDRAVLELVQAGWWPAAIWLQAWRLRRAGGVAEPWFQLGFMVTQRARAIENAELLFAGLRCVARARQIRPSHLAASVFLDHMALREEFRGIGPYRGDPMEVATLAEASFEDLRGALVDAESASVRRSARRAVMDQEDGDLSLMPVIDALDHEKDVENLREVLVAATVWTHVPEVAEAVRAVSGRPDAAALEPELGEALASIEEEVEDE